MKLVAAPNALKGSLSAFDAARAIAKGAARAAANADVVELAIADGGDGTAEVICRARGGVFRAAEASDGLGRVRAARYAWLEDGTAVIDVATASGLALLAPSERRALHATSFGTGQLVRAALDAGCSRILLGVGGSASVDGGAGILEALGAQLLDEAGVPLPRGGGALERLARIDLSRVTPRAREVPIAIACDVDSPLLGEAGAARLFGPQKGATPGEVERLEVALARFARVIAGQLGVDVAGVPAGGAAGGIAAGLHAVLGARLASGIDLVLDAVGFDAALEGATLCITAEGRLDRQSLRNKGPIGVARRAAARGVPAIALAGDVESDLEDADFPELAGIFSICSGPVSSTYAMQHAAALLERAAERCTRLFVRARSS